MPRLPNDAIERVKQEIPVAAVCAARGIALRQHGADLIGSCPFHDDRTPSFVVSELKNLWHCLGKCQAGGSVIDLVMRLDGVGFRKATEILLAQAGMTGSASGDKETVITARRTPAIRALPSPLAHGAEDAVLLKQVVNYYHRCLTPESAGWAYLVKRGVGNAEAVAAFGIGYVDRSLNARVAYRSVKAGAELRTRLHRLGILNESGNRERFDSRVVFPWTDGDGHIAGMYGRMTSDTGLRGAQARHLYLPGAHRGIWNAAGISGVGAESGGVVILCEAIIDALTCWVHGFRGVTAAYGVNGFTADHRAAFAAAGVRGVLIAYDRDAAGDAAAASLGAELIAQGLPCWRVEFPAGLDANAYALRMTEPAAALGRVFATARWLGAGSAPALPGLGSASASVLKSVSLSTSVQDVSVLAAKKERSAVAAAIAATISADDSGDDFVVIEEQGEYPAAAPAVPAAVATSAAMAPAAASAAGASDDVVITIGTRTYQVRGLAKNRTREVLRVTMRVTDDTGRLHLDTLDVYHARQRTASINGAAEELGVTPEVVKHDVGTLLRTLEQAQDQRLTAAAAAANGGANDAAPAPPPLSPAEEAEALALLRDPRLVERILADFATCGVVGEAVNTLVGYIAAVSRKLAEPLAIIVQSLSAAGKSTLMEAIVAFVPEEERVRYSAMTGQSLFYLGQGSLKHKVLAIAEAEGAANASYALKLLQSEGELTIASTGKDPQSGKLVTQEYRVEGPIMLIVTTTAVELDEELANRCIVLAVDEDRDQTKRIHEQQRRRQTLAGLEASQDRTRLLRLHRNAQRLLQPLFVNNPWAERLTFLDDRTRTRRDHVKYLTLIRAIALLHQHQRPIKHHTHRGEVLPYIDVSLSDIALANVLAHQALGRSLDALPPHSRALLTQLDALVTARCAAESITRADCWFTRRAVREATRWTDRQVRMHLDKLVALEYVLVHRGGRGQSFVYELLYDGQGQDGQPFVMGLIDVAALASASGEAVPNVPALLRPSVLKPAAKKCDLDVNRDAKKAGFDYPLTPHRRGFDVGLTGGESADFNGENDDFSALDAESRLAGISPPISQTVIHGHPRRGLSV